MTIPVGGVGSGQRLWNCKVSALHEQLSEKLGSNLYKISCLHLSEVSLHIYLGLQPPPAPRDPHIPMLMGSQSVSPYGGRLNISNGKAASQLLPTITPTGTD